MTKEIKLEALITDVFINPLCVSFRVIDSTLNSEEIKELKIIQMYGKTVTIIISDAFYLK